MLSFARGKPIAKIVEGKKKGTIIHTFGENIFDKDTKSDITIPKDQRSQLLDKEFFKEEKIGRNKREYFSELIDGKINI